MDPPVPSCRHRDVRTFDGVRCCLECGLSLFDEADSDSDLASLTEETPQYTYRPLDYTLGQEIRLVHLFPGKYTDDLICDIVHVNFQHKPRYEALSYTWGAYDLRPRYLSPNGTELSNTILCRGRYIPIGKNCAAALRRLRLRIGTRAIWVDALCINQKDIQERNHQVPLMKQIYSTAVQVVVYLGEHDHTSNKVVDFLEQPVEDQSLPWEELRRFFARAWFARVWAIQEAVLAKMVTMMVGERKFHWDKTAIERVTGYKFYECPAVLHWPPGHVHYKGLLTTLQLARHCKSSDPRDKVFALLGLLDEADQALVNVDYNKTTSEIFIDLAVNIVTNGDNLDILSHALGTAGPSQPDSFSMRATLPSWVPDWTFIPQEPFEHYGSRFQFSKEDNDLISSWEFSTSQAADTETPPPHQSPDDLPTNNSWHQPSAPVNSMTDTFGVTLSRKPYVGSRPFSVITTPLDPNTPSRPRHRLRVRAHKLDTITENEFDKFHYIYGNFPHSRPPAFGSNKPCPCTNDSQKGNAHFTKTLSDDIKSSSAQRYKDLWPFQTENSVAFVREGCAVGDEIWALDGGRRCPFVLRRVGGSFVLMGECFLFGAMRPWHPCVACGRPLEVWPITTEWITIL